VTIRNQLQIRRPISLSMWPFDSP